jgi:hypothetical protein
MPMTALAFLIVIVVVLALGAAFGTDSRVDRPGRQY